MTFGAKLKSVVTGMFSALLAASSSAHASTTDHSPKAADPVNLRDQGAPSEAAVTAIMDKWKLTKERSNQLAQQTTFTRFDTPTHIRS
ncbi:hypothetical protein AB7M49_001809 [Bradyrhizobium elkanii]